MIAPVQPCPICEAPTPYDWGRCGSCGAQRLVAADGSHAGFVPLAGPWRRLLAVLLDLALFAVPTAFALLVLPDRVANPSPAAGDEDLLAVIGFALILYGPVAIGARARTVGKRVMGIHVVDDDGRLPTYPRAAVREGVGKVLLLGSLLALPGLIMVLGEIRDELDRSESIAGSVVGAVVLFAVLFLPGISLGLLFADPRRRPPHDRMAGTVVVRGAPLSRTAAALPVPPGVPASDAPAA